MDASTLTVSLSRGTQSQHSKRTPLFVGQQVPPNPNVTQFSFSEHIAVAEEDPFHESVLILSSSVPFGGP